MDTEALIHAVLHLEQVLTTGTGLLMVGGMSLALSQGPRGLPWACRQPVLRCPCQRLELPYHFDRLWWFST